jgi:hypothetical protein
MPHLIDGIPGSPLGVRIADFDHLINGISTIDRQRKDRTPPAAIIGAQERSFSGIRADIPDTHHLQRCGK